MTTPAVGVSVGSRSARPRRVSPCSYRSALSTIALGLAVLWLSVSASSAVPAAAAAPNSLGLHATYDVHASLRWRVGAIRVSSTARVTNSSGRKVHALTFNLLPLALGRVDRLRITVAGKTVATRAFGQTIVVLLPRWLQPGKHVRVRISYRAHFA